MRCRICDQTGKSFVIANKEERMCRLCMYMLQLTVTSLSEHWADVIVNSRSIRMKDYYKNRGIIRV